MVAGRLPHPPFCILLSVAKKEREGSRNAGILARPCPNRLGWEDWAHVLILSS